MGSSKRGLFRFRAWIEDGSSALDRGRLGDRMELQAE